MNFAERLCAAMKKEGVTQAELATRTGIDLTNVCHLVHGRRTPSLATLRKLLKALPKVDARKLITEGS